VIFPKKISTIKFSKKNICIKGCHCGNFSGNFSVSSGGCVNEMGILVTYFVEMYVKLGFCVRDLMGMRSDFGKNF
jgi:hypothetical protein